MMFGLWIGISVLEMRYVSSFKSYWYKLTFVRNYNRYNYQKQIHVHDLRNYFEIASI
jgi:hypothetical protein